MTATAILFSVLLVVVVGAILYGVLTHKKRLDAEDKLGLPNVKVFDRDWVPLTLIVSSELSDHEDTLLEAVRSAANYWNERTGLTLFADLGEVLDSGHVVPIMPAPDDGDHEHSIAYTRYSVDANGALRSAAVYMKPEWLHCTKQVLERAMTHEFGHCLGLTHDGIHGSVMYGAALNGIYSITDKDAAFLRGVYGGLST